MSTERMLHHADQGTPEQHWRDRRVWARLPRLDARLLTGRVICVSAHPDDETLGASGLIQRAHGLGGDVVVITATAGEGSHPGSPTLSPAALAERRIQELSDAVAHLAPGTHPRCLQLPDGDVASHEATLAARIEQEVRSGDPATTVIVCPWRGDGHPDHEAVGRASASAAAASGAHLIEYPIWLWQWGTDADAPWDRMAALDLTPQEREGKAKALAAHVTQVQPLSDDALDAVLLGPHLLAHFERPFEVYLPQAAAPASTVFEDLHQREPDPWGVDTRWYERRKRAVTVAALGRERYSRGLEVGCSIGALTADLADRVDDLVGVDASRTALHAARERLDRTRGEHRGRVRLAQAQVPGQWPPGTFELVVLSEVGYFLGPDDLDGVLDRALDCLTDDGELVLVHWRGDIDGWPLDGDGVHARALRRTSWHPAVHHVEDDFALLVLQRPGRATPAQRDGLR